LAEQLEHIEAKDLTDRLETFLGHPVYDPHGDPIPDKNGKIKAHETIALSSAIKGKHYIVKSFADTSDVFLDYLSQQEIKPGLKIKIVQLHEFDQSLEILSGKKQFQLSQKVALNIFIQPL
ncbi:MAG: metal-dependent transcriptional regulator, partial [Flavisolibacter sp.]|nr:metal-dependent transcriptional regulator [Flavisolibacter sp.]